MMRRISFALAVALVATGPGTAAAWSHSGAFGSASGGGGSWSASGYRGGSASGGDGSWSGTGFRGGTASGGGGYGTTAYGHAYYGGVYSTYHPPTVVNHYYGAGCYNCGGWNAAGAAVGGFLGARLAQERAAQQAAAAPPPPSYVMGGIYPTLPAGCTQSQVGGGSYYSCGGTWFSASFGANGVYYRVVPAPAS